jgi:hypothetical protein
MFEVDYGAQFALAFHFLRLTTDFHTLIVPIFSCAQYAICVVLNTTVLSLEIVMVAKRC